MTKRDELASEYAAQVGCSFMDDKARIDFSKGFDAAIALKEGNIEELKEALQYCFNLIDSISSYDKEIQTAMYKAKEALANGTGE